MKTVPLLRHSIFQSYLGKPERVRGTFPLNVLDSEV